jgi:hypothetical protein
MPLSAYPIPASLDACSIEYLGANGFLFDVSILGKLYVLENSLLFRSSLYLLCLFLFESELVVLIYFYASEYCLTRDCFGVYSFKDSFFSLVEFYDSLLLFYSLILA